MRYMLAWFPSTIRCARRGWPFGVLTVVDQWSRESPLLGGYSDVGPHGRRGPRSAPVHLKCLGTCGPTFAASADQAAPRQGGEQVTTVSDATPPSATSEPPLRQS